METQTLFKEGELMSSPFRHGGKTKAAQKRQSKPLRWGNTQFDRIFGRTVELYSSEIWAKVGKKKRFKAKLEYSF